jgi:antitoxin HicB
MKQWLYPFKIIREADEYLVLVRDLPEIITSGSSYEEALALAQDAIEVCVEARLEQEEELVFPSCAHENELTFALPATLAAKAGVYVLWKASGLTKSELARKLGKNENEARRLLSTKYNTKLPLLEEATRLLGGQMIITYA